MSSVTCLDNVMKLKWIITRLEKVLSICQILSLVDFKFLSNWNKITVLLSMGR